MDRRVRTALFVTVAMLLGQGIALAAPVSPLRAVQAAGAALARGVDRAASGSGRIAFSQAEPTVTPRVQDGRVVYYTVADPSGWAVVAADDAVYPVLAYSDKPVDPSVTPPPAYVWWMDQTAAQISTVIAMGLKAGPEVEEAWATLEPTAELTPMAPGDVGPLMSTTWNQGTGYNTYCPVDANATSSGGRVWAGCVATTMAQIMKYYNWPVQGVGSHSDTNSGYGTLSVSPGNTSYGWSSMTLNSGSASSALLMYHAGVAANMRYGASGSGATVESARLGLIDHFRYKSSATHVYRSNYDQSTWTALVKAELDAARPIFYAGYNASSGHAFVVDGYRAADGLFHLNWGWGSAYDGYFQLNALNPGSYTFNIYQEAIFGIAPDNRTIVERPTFSVAPGTYNSARSVQFSCATAGASVRYTLDNTVPTETNGTLYNLTTRPAISITATKTLRAIAFKTGMAQSYQAAGNYTIVTAVAATPTMSPPAGTYGAGQTVALASATAGATIRYTTDGSTPSQFAGTVYTSPISVGASQTIRAIAYKTGYNAQSALATGAYSIVAATAAAPKASLVQGTYSGTKSVTLSTTTTGAVIKYTLDGTTPTQWNGTTYSAAFSVSSTNTLKAIAYKAGTHASSTILTATIRIVSPTAALPTFSLGAGTYAGSQTLTITCSTPGAYIYYTVNGTTPTQVGNRYTVPLTIASSQTVNAIAVVPSSYGQSAVKSAAYYIVAGVAAAPKASLVAGTYTGAKTVTLSTTTVGAVIKYTLDGTIPSQTTGMTYSTGISISSTKTLRAIAYKAGSYATSAILGVAYKIVSPSAAIPTFTLAAGTYAGSQTLTITSSTPGAYIYYTVNGTSPSQVGNRYTVPLTIASSQTVNAIAVVPSSYGQSAIKAAAYSIVADVAATPKASLVAGTYTGTKTVTLSTTTVGAVIRYTLDGTTPSQTNGTTYSTGISISSTTTLRAIAYKAGSYATSAILGVSYRIVTPTAAVPTFNLAAGTYTTSKTLSMTCSTAGANIHYTTNGTTPTQASTKYTTPLTIGTTQTVNAIAVVPATHGQSGVRSAAYTINLVGEPLAARAPIGEEPSIADIFGTEDFVTVEAGAFNMGSPEGQGSPNEYPLHEALIEEPFAILKREVTVDQFSQLMGEGPWSDPACAQCPATFVSRDDAEEFVARLNLMKGEALYGLPTETQWEYAARGGQYSLGRIYPGAENEEGVSAIAWFAGSQATQTAVTMGLAPNELGLFDMAGNAAEWVSDDYSPYGVAPVPLGFGIVRGGSYADTYADLRCASRKAAPVDGRSGAYGFRLVRAIR